MFKFPISDDAWLALALQHHAPAFLANIDRDRALFETWLPWTAKITNEPEARAFIDRFLNKLAAADGILLNIWADGMIVGGVLLRTVDWSARRTEIGYWIGTGHQGRGLVTRAAAAVIDYAFDEMGLDFVALQAAVDNRPSQAVAERLGFRREGTLRHSYAYAAGILDHAVYGLLAEEWREAKRAGS